MWADPQALGDLARRRKAPVGYHAADLRQAQLRQPNAPQGDRLLEAGWPEADLPEGSPGRLFPQHE